ncbi:MAG: DUF2325 domain-containing protein [Alphaproteobacteria bacterium]
MTDAFQADRSSRPHAILMAQPATARFAEPALLPHHHHHHHPHQLPAFANVDEAQPRKAPLSRRLRLNELKNTLHCSIIGTCLTMGELREVARRFMPEGSKELDAASDQDVHEHMVLAAGQSPLVSRQINKALDRRHAPVIRRFAAARDEAAVREAWRTAFDLGDIPGAYWAVLTHPAAGEELRQEAFGEVHMLSHLLGASNRADIRRLRSLEADNAALQSSLAHAQLAHRQALAERDARIAQLEQSLAGEPERLREAAANALQHNAAELASLRSRLDKEAAARAHAELKHAALSEEVEALRASRADLESELAATMDELIAQRDSATDHTARADRSADDATPHRLDGQSILIVGARNRQAVACRSFIERRGGVFLHHDGGLEQSIGTLAGLISRASIVLVAIDCVSHEAALLVKRQAGKAGQPWLPLRTASLTALAQALGAAPQRRIEAREPAASGG